MTLEEWKAKLLEQSNICAICKTDDPGRRGWSVDHDHETGKVRDLLCFNCNAGLGKFGDDVSLLQAAIEYLKRHGQ